MLLKFHPLAHTKPTSTQIQNSYPSPHLPHSASANRACRTWVYSLPASAFHCSVPSCFRASPGTCCTPWRPSPRSTCSPIPCRCRCNRPPGIPCPRWSRRNRRWLPRGPDARGRGRWGPGMRCWRNCRSSCRWRRWSSSTAICHSVEEKRGWKLLIWLQGVSIFRSLSKSFVVSYNITYNTVLFNKKKPKPVSQAISTKSNK